MIVHLRSSGFIGQAFQTFFRQRDIAYAPISRSSVNIYAPAELAACIREHGASFLVNCAGNTGKPNVDAYEAHMTECLLGNGCLPGLASEACQQAGIPWGHVLSGCIYTGARSDGSGFTELDPPNSSFRQDNCSFYSGTKALGEECLRDDTNCFIWRLRIPFSHEDNPRNNLTKVMPYNRLLDARNSLSQMYEFVAACFDCWDKRVEFGIYNLTNGGSVTTREVVDMIRKSGVCHKNFEFFDDESQFMQQAAVAPRSNTVMDNSKALAAGLKLSPVQEALEHALQHWQTAASV